MLAHEQAQWDSRKCLGCGATTYEVTLRERTTGDEFAGQACNDCGQVTALSQCPAHAGRGRDASS